MARMETPHLDGIRIARPCSASWHDMHGDDKSRRCDHCRLQVFNLSGMTTEEAETLIERRTGKGRTCVRYFKRRDGTVLTADCPRGVSDRWRHVEVRVIAACAAVMGAMFADYYHEGPTHTVVSPAIHKVANLLSVNRLRHLGEVAEGEIDNVDPNL